MVVTPPPLLSLSLIFVHMYARTCTLVHSFSPLGLRRPKTLTIRPHLILLVRRSRDVVRNTYVTPKLIRYNFTGRPRSSISPYRIQAVGLPARLPSACLPCLPARCLDCQPVSSAALVIGFPRFSQLFLKSLATLPTISILFTFSSRSSSLFLARAWCFRPRATRCFEQYNGVSSSGWGTIARRMRDFAPLIRYLRLFLLPTLVGCFDRVISLRRIAQET